MKSLSHMLQNLRADSNDAKMRKDCSSLHLKDTANNSVSDTHCLFTVTNLATETILHNLSIAAVPPSLNIVF